jgi:hypothetical protein
MNRRRGTLLIVVAGGCALMAALATAFLLRMRSTVEETDLVAREAQARIMLLSACCYVVESSRLGYDASPHAAPKPHGHIEAFGWLDVREPPREGANPLAIGPRDQTGAPLWTAGRWPAIGGAAARCPMHRWERPPYAIASTVAPNAISTDRTSPDFGRPYLRNRDPMPLARDWDAFASGNPAPVAQSAGMAWFRCYRESAARFIVTCGAGASEGWKDWSEVPPGERARFQDDPALFAEIVAQERRMWYRVEWSAAVVADNYHSIDYHVNSIGEHYYLIAVNGVYGNGDGRSQMRAPNPVGTIRWVERLPEPPAAW